MNYRLVAAMLLLAPLVSCVTGPDWGAYDPASLDAMTPQDWQNDLDTLAAELRRLHGPTLYHAVEETELMSAVDRARAGSVSATNDETLVEIHRLLALVGEGHTGVNATPDLYYPIALRWYPEGVFVVRAEAARPEILGRRVLTVGGRSIAELEQAIDPLTSVDLPGGRPVVRPSIVINTRLMRGLGIAGSGGLVLELDGLGEVTIAALGPDDTFTGTSWLQTLDQESLPVSLRPRTEQYWYDHDEASGLLYLRYDVCTSDAVPLFNEVLDLLRAGTVRRLVVDLRWNGGGSSLPGKGFADAVAAFPALYVLIGPRTFSSAMMNAMDFRAGTRAILAGEPLVEPAGHYGEVRRFVLPASGLVIGTSTRFFDYGLGLVPDSQSPETWVLAPHAGWEHTWTWAEYSAGRDPVLESVSSTP